jgi:restriction system protein
MAARYRPRRRLPGCGTALLLLAVVAGSVWVVVRSVTLWITGHPEAVALVVAFGALGGFGMSRAATTITPAREFTALTPGEFEQAVAELCRRDGCRHVQVVGGPGDLAADVLATAPDGRRVLVQCKRYAPTRSVGSPDVQRVGGTYQIVHGADLAIVVATAGYTADAREYAERAGIRLVDHAELQVWARGGRPPWS